MKVTQTQWGKLCLYPSTITTTYLTSYDIVMLRNNYVIDSFIFSDNDMVLLLLLYRPSMIAVETVAELCFRVLVGRDCWVPH